MVAEPQLEAALMTLDTRLKKEMHDSYAQKILDYENLVRTIKSTLQKIISDTNTYKK